MKYNRKELLAAAERAVQVEHHAQRQHHAKAVAKAAGDVTTWTRDYAQDWHQTIRKIRRKLTAGEPILASDLPSQVGRPHQVATFQGSLIGKFVPHTPPELGALIKALTLVSDETVTTAAFRDLGISSNTMRVCLEYMAAGTVRA